MAWTSGCSGTSNEELVHNLQNAGIVSNSEAIAAMLATDRALYAPPIDPQLIVSATYNYGPYADAPQSIGHKVTISAPYIHATVLEVLHQQILGEHKAILDVGSGSGILLAYIARMTSSSSTVVGVEVVPELVSMAIENLTKDSMYSAAPDDSSVRNNSIVSEANVRNCGKIIVEHGDGWDGAAKYGPFDAINVGASAATIPMELVKQLKPNGVLLIPIGMEQASQTLTKITKLVNNSNGAIDEDYVLVQTPIRTVRFVPLVEKKPSVDWNLRYKNGWAYGKDANNYLKSAVECFVTPQSKVLSVLSLGEGQGRNVTFLASLGHRCTAVDFSDVGLKKAQKLAEQRGLSDRITTITADVLNFDMGVEQYDLIISIFCMFPESSRKVLHQRCIRALKPGGLVILECFSRVQQAIRESSNSKDSSWSLGPPTDCLVDCIELEKDFDGLKVLESNQVQCVLREGAYHKGSAALSQLIVQKELANNTDMRYVQNLYKRSVDTVFQEVARFLSDSKTTSRLEDAKEKCLNVACSELVRPIGISLNDEKDFESSSDCNFVIDDTKDKILSCADRLIRSSCERAIHSRWCRYCWCPEHHCFCNAIEDKISRYKLAMVDQSCGKNRLDIHWVIVSHPNEFLRSTSSARIAAQYLTSVSRCDFLVYGCQQHMQVLQDLVSNQTDHIYLLFPESVEEIRQMKNKKARKLIDPERIQNQTAMRETSVNQNCATSLRVKELLQPVERKSSECTDKSVVTIIVPDGSWECARSLVLQIASISKTTIPSVSLDASLVARHHSSLIESLKSGQGQGRISTLEACVLLLRELGYEQCSEQLLGSLDTLVTYVQQNFSALQVVNEDRKVDNLNGFFGNLLDLLSGKIQMYLKTLEKIEIPLGLRRCELCGENLATPSRMEQHVRGKKHCIQAVQIYLSKEMNLRKAYPQYVNPEHSSELAEVLHKLFNRNFPSTDLSISEELCREIYQRCSIDILENCTVEPPDVAMESLKAVDKSLTVDSQELVSKATNHLKAAAEQQALYTKGERELLSTPMPYVVEQLPESMRHKEIVSFSVDQYDFYGVTLKLLKLLPSVGHFPEDIAPDTPNCLEKFKVTADVFRNFHTRQSVYNAVGCNKSFLEIYEKLVIEVCCPLLKKKLLANEKISSLNLDEFDGQNDKTTAKFSFHYQYPPTLRIQEGPSTKHGRAHRDLEYGHQIGEINFWMPITDYSLTHTTLLIEQNEKQANFVPLEINYGKIGIFHGSLLHHYAPNNPSNYTRVSIDFRIGIDKYFDPNWQLKGAKGKHDRKILRL